MQRLSDVRNKSGRSRKLNRNRPTCASSSQVVHVHLAHCAHEQARRAHATKIRLRVSGGTSFFLFFFQPQDENEEKKKRKTKALP